MAETAVFWPYTATGSTLANPRSHASRRLPIAGVFFGLQSVDNGDASPLARNDRRANSADANTNGESHSRSRIFLLNLGLAKEITVVARWQL